MKRESTTVALADDHKLLRNGLASLINRFDGYSVLFEADNGQDFIEKLTTNGLPVIALLDINMPVKDGFETAAWLQQHHPEVKIIALSMYDNETCIIKMLRHGARGYLLKDTEPPEFHAALESVLYKGFYYSDMVTGKLIHAVDEMNEAAKGIDSGFIKLNNRETEFLKYACTEMTYKEIAEKMFLSPRTIDGYRDALFDKLNIKTRVGLVMYAIRERIVRV